MYSLQKRLDSRTNGALSALNRNVSNLGLKGHITVAPLPTGDTIFIFTGYKDGQTKFFRSVLVKNAEDLAAEVATSEEIRTMRKQKTRKVIWS